MIATNSVVKYTTWKLITKIHRHVSENCTVHFTNCKGAQLKLKIRVFTECGGFNDFVENFNNTKEPTLSLLIKHQIILKGNSLEKFGKESCEKIIMNLYILNYEK
jgi:hypothetical protein